MLLPAIEMSRGFYSTETIRDAVLLGDMQLWIAGDPIDLACLTEIIVAPTGDVKILNFFALGGMNLPDHYKEGMREIEAWGRDMGCNRARIEGRKEWRRVSGYDPVRITLEKDL